MTSKKNNHIKQPEINPGNPADEGVDHNISEGPEKDLGNSYIQKQESNGGRGVDNEDTTDALDSEEKAESP